MAVEVLRDALEEEDEEDEPPPDDVNDEGLRNRRLTFKLKLAKSPIYNSTMTNRYHRLVQRCLCRKASASNEAVMLFMLAAVLHDVSIPAP